MGIKRAVSIFGFFLSLSILALLAGCGGGGGGDDGNSRFFGTFNSTLTEGACDPESSFMTIGSDQSMVSDTYLYIPAHGSTATYTYESSGDVTTRTVTISGNTIRLDASWHYDASNYYSISVVYTFSNSYNNFIMRGSSDSDPSQCHGMIEGEGTEVSTVNYADYSGAPSITYECTYGEYVGEEMTCYAGDNVTIPYTSGSVTATEWIRPFPDGNTETAFVSNDGRKVAIYGVEDEEEERWYISYDEDLTGPSPAFMYGDVTDGLMIDQEDASYWVRPDLSDSLEPDQGVLFRVQDVTVQGVAYQDAVVMYTFDYEFAFSTVNWDGADNFGLDLPTADETGNKSITDISISAEGIGEVAIVYVDVETGDVITIYEMTSHD